MKFEDLTISQYIKVTEVAKENISEIEKRIKLLEIILEKNVDNLPIDSFKEIEFLNNIPKDIKFKKSIFIGLKRYKVCTDLTEIGVNQLVDFYALSKANAPINELLPIVYKPYNADNHKELSKAFLKKKVGDVLGTVFFFKKFFKQCEIPIQAYLESKFKQIQEIQTEIQTDSEFMDFLNTGGGSTTSTYVLKTKG